MVVGAYATQVEPFWPRIYERPIPIRNLPAAFEGYRVAHLTDLHAGYVSLDYLRGVVRRVADLNRELESTISTLTRIMELHRTLSEIVADGGETGIAAALHRLTGLPVVIQDMGGNTRAAANNAPGHV